MDFDYDEIAEALGEEPDFGDDDFEEIMSTHYGRMIAATTGRSCSPTPRTRPSTSASTSRPRRADGTRVRPQEDPCTRRTARSTSSSTATCTSGTPAPQNWVAGPGEVRQGLDRVLPRLPGARPARDALADRALPEVLRGRPDEGRLRGRPRRRGDLPVDVPQGVVHATGFNTTEQNGALAERHPGKFIVNTRWDPRDGDAGPAAARGRPRPSYGLQGRQALHRRVAGAARAAGR